MLKKVISNLQNSESYKIVVIVFLFLLVILWSIALVYSNNFYNYPEGAILFTPNDRYMDFVHYAKQTFWLGSDQFFLRKEAYPFILGAPTALFYALYSKSFSPNYILAAYVYLSTVVFILFSMIFLVIHRVKKAQGNVVWFTVSLFLILLFAYPLWFLLDRANPEGFVFIALIMGFFLADKRDGVYSAFFIGLAASMKFFPAIFLFWFIYRKEYKAFFLAVLVAIIMTLVGLIIIGPTPLQALSQIICDMGWYNNQYNLGLMGSSELRFYHSIFASIKNIIMTFYNGQIDLAVVYKIYIGIAIVSMLGLLYGIKNLPRINQLFILVLMMVLFAPMSADYRLIQIIIPLVALFAYIFSTKDEIKGTLLANVLMPIVLIWVPTSQIHFGDWWVGGILKFVGLFWLLITLMIIKFHSEKLWPEAINEGK